MDWKLKLMQILDCVAEQEGRLFERNWPGYGITDEERAEILAEYEMHEATVRFKNRVDQVIHDADDEPEADPSEGAEIYDLESFLAEGTFEKDDPMAHVDILWCRHSFAITPLIRDLDTRGVVMRPPKTRAEKRTLLMNLRWLTNWQAHKWHLTDLVHEEDWFEEPPRGVGG